MGLLRIIVVLSLAWLTISWEVLRFRIYFPKPQYVFSITKLYHVIMAALSLAYSIPINVGVPIRVFLFKQLLQIGYSVSIGVVLFDLILSYAITGGIALIGIQVLFPTHQSIVLAFSIIIVLMLLIAIYSARNMNIGIEKSTGSFFLPKKYIHWVFLKLRPAFVQLDIKTIATNSVLFVTGIILASLRLESILLGMGEDLQLLKVAFIACIAYALGMISMIPLGFGVREVTMIILLEQSGIDVDVAATGALIERLMTTGLGFCLGLFSIYHLGLRKNLTQHNKATYI
jgi:uncharacterized protein (TIRG00374 family)